jgi:hypothetical protein
MLQTWNLVGSDAGRYDPILEAPEDGGGMRTGAKYRQTDLLNGDQDGVRELTA